MNSSKNVLIAISLLSIVMQQVNAVEIVDNNDGSSKQYHQYLVATYEQSTGDVKNALKSYKQILKSKPSPHAYNGFLTLLFDVGQAKMIIETYEAHEQQLRKTFADNVDIQLILAQSYLAIKQDGKAEKIFMHLATNYPDNEQVAYFTVTSYIKNRQLDRADNFIKKCLKNPALKQKHFLFYFLQSKILVEQNNFAGALKVIEKSLELFPKFDRAWLFKAVLLEQMGKINDAISGYKHFLNLVGSDINVEKQLVQLLFAQQRFSEASEYLKKAHANSPDYYFDLALIEFKAHKLKSALELTEKALKLAPTFSKARLLKVEILLETKQITTLLAYMQNWVSSTLDDPSVLHTLLLLRKAHVPTATILKTLHQIEKQQPHVNILSAIADLYVETNNNKQALAYYEKIAAAAKDPELKSKALFQIGYIHFVTNQPDKLEKALKQATETSKAYPSACNLLAYHYARSNKNLPQALALVERALQSAPECYYFLDTKAVILLKQGRRNDAIALFKQALELSPGDMVIKNHLRAAQGRKS